MKDKEHETDGNKKVSRDEAEGTLDLLEVGELLARKMKELAILLRARRQRGQLRQGQSETCR